MLKATGSHGNCSIFGVISAPFSYYTKGRKEFEENELEQIYDLVKKGSYNNMVTLNASLFSLIKDGSVAEEVAIAASNDPNELKQMLRGVYHGTKQD